MVLGKAFQQGNEQKITIIFNNLLIRGAKKTEH